MKMMGREIAEFLDHVGARSHQISEEAPGKGPRACRHLASVAGHAAGIPQGYRPDPGVIQGLCIVIAHDEIEMPINVVAACEKFVAEMIEAFASKLLDAREKAGGDVSEAARAIDKIYGMVLDDREIRRHAFDEAERLQEEAVPLILFRSVVVAFDEVQRPAGAAILARLAGGERAQHAGRPFGGRGYKCRVDLCALH